MGGVRKRLKESITCSSARPTAPGAAAGRAPGRRRPPPPGSAAARGQRGAVPTISSLGADIAPRRSQQYSCDNTQTEVSCKPWPKKRFYFSDSVSSRLSSAAFPDSAFWKHMENPSGVN